MVDDMYNNELLMEETKKLISQKRKNLDPSRKKEVSEKIKQSRYKHARKIYVDGITYESMHFCSKELDIHENTIRYRIKSKNFPNYYYV